MKLFCTSGPLVQFEAHLELTVKGELRVSQQKRSQFFILTVY